MQVAPLAAVKTIPASKETSVIGETSALSAVSRTNATLIAATLDRASQVLSAKGSRLGQLAH